MTNITYSTHKGLSEAIQNNIELYKKINGSEDALAAFKANLEALKLIYNEYTNKIKEVRELIESYGQLQNCVRLNFRNARNWKNGHQHAPFVIPDILINASKNIRSMQKASGPALSNKKNTTIKFTPATTANQ